MKENKDKKIILVVDDTVDNIALLSNILSSKYKVKAATNGEKALEIANAEPRPDIILLDIMMPGMSGYEVCKKLKQEPSTKAIPVIFITAKTTVEDEQYGFELGAIDYITKPFDPVIVETRIRSQLSVYAESKRLFQENIKLKEQVSDGFHFFIENDLLQLIDTGESNIVEFKSTLRRNLHTGMTDKRIENACLKTIAAFLNSSGGVLLVGIDDDGNAIGISKDNFKNEDKQLLHLNNLIRSHIGVEYSQFIRSDMTDLNGERILLIQSIPSPRPVFFSRDDEEVFYMRAGNATQKLKPSEILAYVDQRS